MQRVSVVMATYNGASFIQDQLDSLAKQDLLPDELVISDDGSTDDTLDIVVAFAQQAPFPVHVHRNETRLGYRSNFMRAAGLARSDLIAFCDQDDIWDPRKLKICAAAFDDPEVLLVYHNARIVTADGRPVGLLERRAAPQPANPPMTVSPWV